MLLCYENVCQVVKSFKSNIYTSPRIYVKNQWESVINVDSVNAS